MSVKQPEIGNVRETFFLSMLSQNHTLQLPINGDFSVDDQFLFEVEGKKKSFKQIQSEENGFLACDDMEIGIGNKIPLWLFGFIY
ncbi:MAG: hypothetical protein V4489_00490 [Chlamydiota bacterium]